MKRLLFAVVLMISTGALAQDTDDKRQVEQALFDYIDAFYTGDTSMIRRSISFDVQKYGYYRTSENDRFQGMAMPYGEMIAYCLDVKAMNRTPDPLWPRKADVFDIQNKTACGKVTTWWGTDYITLAKEDGKWMIKQVLWQSR